MAPYAVAHFKIGLALAAMDEEPLFRQQWSYEPQGNERVNIFLTNTLEDLEHTAEQLGPLRILSNEANSAYEVKKHKPVLVVLGNPPYSNFGQQNRNPWILGLLDDYKRGLNEKKLNLNDDFIKFVRWAQWRIDQTGQGVIGFIIRNVFLDGITHRRMRECLLEAFDEIYFVNLHGSVEPLETCPDGSKDDNVFDIKKGVTIALFVKGAESWKKQKKAHAVVRYAEIWGHRANKYGWLDDHHVANTKWEKLKPEAPGFYFVPKESSPDDEYQKWWSVRDLFPLSGNGIKTERDGVCIQFVEKDIKQVIGEFQLKSVAELRNAFGLGPDSRDWSIERAKADALENAKRHLTNPILYRPFDVRFTWYSGRSKGFIGTPASSLMQHFLLGENLGLITTRQTKDTFAVLATNIISGHKSCAGYDINTVFPLYLYPNGKLPEEDLFAHDNGRRPNLSAAFIKDFCEKLKVKFVPDGFGRPAKREVGPECIFNYAYAVFHSPAYRERYAEFLRADFPRLPLTSNWDLFRELAGLGHWLVDLHAKGQGRNTPVGYPVKGEDKITDIRFQPAESLLIPGGKKMKSTTPCGQVETGSWPDIKAGRVWINDKQYFEPVPETAWAFPIGGYLPAQRWLKDRIGRILGYEEQAEYQRIIWALIETKRLMGEIDASIQAHGGWPMK
jgi:predicted helicase